MFRLPPQPWMTDPAAVAVFNALEAEGGDGCARYVGGCVRNAVMNLPAHDADVATTLTPERVIAAAKAAGLKAVPTGVEHGTVTLISGRKPFEVTTLRRDVETDGRRAVVAFTDDWAEDAGRRDFRLNALYADREGGLYDPTGGGLDDARAGRIAFVGEPQARIREDYLRILRFFRFLAWYGRGRPDASGLAACAELVAGLDSLSAERVTGEMLKLLSAPDPRQAVRLMEDAGVLGRAVPGARRSMAFEALIAITVDPVERLAGLLTDVEAAEAALARLRLPNAAAARVRAILAPGEDVSTGMTPPAARAALYRLGGPTFEDRLRRAWSFAPERGAEATALLALAADWPIPRLPVGGADVAALGVTPSPETGRLLAEVERWWVEQDFPESGARERLAELVNTPDPA